MELSPLDVNLDSDESPSSSSSSYKLKKELITSNNHRNCFIFDCYTEIFVWMGKKSSSKEKQIAKQVLYLPLLPLSLSIDKYIFISSSFAFLSVDIHLYSSIFIYIRLYLSIFIYLPIRYSNGSARER